MDRREMADCGKEWRRLYVWKEKEQIDAQASHAYKL